MRSSDLAAGAIVLALSATASADPGFSTERFSPAPAGARFVALDDLATTGIGGALALTTSYARRPWHVGEGRTRVDLVRDQAFVGVGASLHAGPLRVSLDLASAVLVHGHAGEAGGARWPGVSVDPASHPDSFADVRLRVDARLLGDARGPFRLGLGAQLWLPAGDRQDFLTDGGYRGVLSVAFAGDAGPFGWAGHGGLHLRPLREPAIEGGPTGSEWVFAVGGGARLPLVAGTMLGLGPELLGATSLRDAFGKATALEILFGGRLEATRPGGAVVRVKLAAGTGLTRAFGAPDARFVLAVEVADRL